jgi:hypothetical protein
MISKCTNKKNSVKLGVKYSWITGLALFRTIRLRGRARKIARVLKSLISTYTLIYYILGNLCWKN